MHLSFYYLIFMVISALVMIMTEPKTVLWYWSIFGIIVCLVAAITYAPVNSRPVHSDIVAMA